VARRYKARLYGLSLLGIVGSNPAGDLDFCLLRVLCFVRQRSLRRADRSSREIYQNFKISFSPALKTFQTTKCCGYFHTKILIIHLDGTQSNILEIFTHDKRKRKLLCGLGYTHFRESFAAFCTYVINHNVHLL
jgi:hypothetical protein